MLVIFITPFIIIVSPCVTFTLLPFLPSCVFFLLFRLFLFFLPFFYPIVFYSTCLLCIKCKLNSAEGAVCALTYQGQSYVCNSLMSLQYVNKNQLRPLFHNKNNKSKKMWKCQVYFHKVI